MPAGVVAEAEGAALPGCGIWWLGRLARRGSGAVVRGAGLRVVLRNHACLKAVMRAARGRGCRLGSPLWCERVRGRGGGCRWCVG